MYSFFSNSLYEQTELNDFVDKFLLTKFFRISSYGEKALNFSNSTHTKMAFIYYYRNNKTKKVAISVSNKNAGVIT